MKSFSKISFKETHPISLVWKQPKFGADYYELSDDLAGDALFATLTWTKWLSDLAVACSAEGIWYFNRIGWTRRTIMATRQVKSTVNSGAEGHPATVCVANFEIGWLWEGDFTLSNDKVFHWYRTKTFRNAWALTEVIADDPLEPFSNVNRPAETDTGKKPARIVRKWKKFRIGRHPKPRRRERLVYEIEFGMHRFKQEAWITLPSAPAETNSELIFLLCMGMYLGYCFNQDAAGAAAVSSTAAVS